MLRAVARRILEILLCDRRVILALAVLYLVTSAAFVLDDYSLNNEGLLTYYWASWARTDFVPVFFLQKVKPVLATLYAPFTAGGPRPMLLVHAMVAATALPMSAETARALGYRLPNLPALAIALSPIFWVGGASGISNVDAVVGVTLVLYLLCARRWVVAAGLVAGLLPWARFELVIFTAVLALHALVTPEHRRLLAGMLGFPLAYALGGVLYHGDVLWMAHYPPSAPHDPGNPIYGNQLIGLRFLLEPAAAVTPAAALVAMVPFDRLKGVERAILGYVVAGILAMNVLPIFRIGNFGSAPRYMLLLLPAFAWLIARAVEPWWEGQRPNVARLIGAALLAAWIATRQEDGIAVAILLAAIWLVLAATLRSGTAAVAIATALVVAGPLLPLRTHASRFATARYLDPTLAWLRESPDRIASPIYTNSQVLGLFLETRLPGAEVVHLAGRDIHREVVLLTNPHNGQRERILSLCATDLYGRTLFEPIEPDDLPADALLVMREDPRLSLLLPDEIWAGRVDWLVRTNDLRIGRMITAR